MSILDLNARLAASGSRFSLAVTGSGMTGATEFFTESGASAFIDEVRIPYSFAASRRLCSWALDDPRKIVCEETARALAKGIWRETYNWRTAPTNGIGIGVTGKLIQNNERLGREHEIWAAAYVMPDQGSFRDPHNKPTPYIVQRLVPTPGSRLEQESQASQFLHQFMTTVSEQVRR